MRAFSRSSGVLATLTLAACASGGPGGPGGPANADPGPTTGPVAATPAAAAPAPAAGEPVYSDAQADRGRDTFRSICTECHDSSEFHDAQFKFKWSRRDLGVLYELVSTTMPEDQPGSLAPQTYADVLAYILRLNGFAAGSTELTPDPELLGAISLAPIRG